MSRVVPWRELTRACCFWPRELKRLDLHLVRFDAEAQEFGFGESLAEVGFVEEEKDGFAGLQGFLGDVAITLVGIFAAVEGE